MRGDEQLSLRPQSFDVLVYLAEHAGRLLTKKELVETFWDPKRAKDDSLVACIRDIREALGDIDHRIIKTVPRRGYLFAPEVCADPPSAEIPQANSDTPPAIAARVENRSTTTAFTTPGKWKQAAIAASLLIAVLSGGGWWLWDALRPQRPAEPTMMAVPSIAVLPFKRLGDDIGEGPGVLADEVSTQLLRVPRGFKIWVRPPAAHKDIAEDPRTASRAVGVRYLVLGAIRREDDAVRVNVQLVEAESGRQLWAEPFGYAAGEPGAQNRVAARIARLVTERLLQTESRRPLPAEPRADHYAILGRALWAGERDARLTMEAMALFEKGLDRDANSVPVLQGYARAKISAVLSGWAPAEQRSLWLDQAEAAIDRVIAQERRSYGAYRLRGSLFRARGDWEQAMKALERALDLNSDYAEAHAELGRIKLEVGLAREAITHIEKAVALSPTDSAALSGWCLWAGQAAVHLGDYKAAVDWLERARQANRANRSPVLWLAVAYAGLGREDKARTEMAEYRNKTPSFTVASWNEDNPRHSAVVSVQRERIEAILRRLDVPAGELRAASTP
jgi:DNA-binding winged helix-turn-helix (wHTH) protein/TolB-like protein